LICVYLPDATDFTTNGIGPVEPLSCSVTETLNGEYGSGWWRAASSALLFPPP